LVNAVSFRVLGRGREAMEQLSYTVKWIGATDVEIAGRGRFLFCQTESAAIDDSTSFCQIDKDNANFSLDALPFELSFNTAGRAHCDSVSAERRPRHILVRLRSEHAMEREFLGKRLST
jgi:hypothetical protein